jgi:hypothetical protein
LGEATLFKGKQAEIAFEGGKTKRFEKCLILSQIFSLLILFAWKNRRILGTKKRGLLVVKKKLLIKLFCSKFTLNDILKYGLKGHDKPLKFNLG